MSTLIDSIAGMTGQRDRDSLEVTVCQVLFDLLQPCELGFHSILPIKDDLHLMTRVSIHAHGGLSAHQTLTEPERLPLLESRPLLAECALAREDRHDPASGLHAFPVVKDGAVTGLLELLTTAPLTPDQSRLARGILVIYGNHLSILDDSERDPLTGLMNRKSLERSFFQLQSAIPIVGAEAGPNGMPDRRDHQEADRGRWLAVADIDHFKRINDRYGHLYGDEVLIIVASILQRGFRITDRLYRYGGEEFVILLDRTPEAGAHIALERFRTHVADRHFPQLNPITVSLGFTRIHALDNPSSAFDRADAALYHAKQNGRNQTAQFERLVAAGHVQPRSTQDDAVLF